VPPTPTQRSRLAERCRTVFAPDAPPPSSFSKRETDELRLLSHWTYAHRDALAVVRWTPDRTATDVVTAIEAVLGEAVEA
jgi:DNA polymerase-3 subunit epsilon